ncbi:uncharacterized protein VTP21DRAFT_10774 [Calcarisporiella thermophila]|uniref:uncharacterized protein n=1 Tax=Calcarisporiella thermophila TaxID=911321 RepID=UPI0037440292
MEDSNEGVIRTMLLDPAKDYKEMAWRNGLGTTYEIAIHPPEKNFHDDEFFWRFSATTIHANCSFSLFPRHDCTIIALPGDTPANTKPSLALNHRGEESNHIVKALFPYTYGGEWPTTCRVINPPINTLNFVMDRSKGKVKFLVEKAGESSAVENGNGSKKLLLGRFTLVYSVEGKVRVSLEENETIRLVGPGQTMVIEREEDSSPTSMVILPADEKGNVKYQDKDATVVIIQVVSTDSKLTAGSDGSTSPVQTIRRPPPRRKGSLIIFDDQPLWNLPQEMIDKMQRNVTSPVLDQTQLPPPLVSPIVEPSIKKDGRLPYKQWDSVVRYEPPEFSSRFQNESDVPPPVVRDRLVIEDFPEEQISTAWIKMVKQGLSEWMRLPVIVARGKEEGPVIGITAAVHGNELNGVPCIHRVVTDIDVHKLKGTVVAVPCVNTSGYLKYQREFADGKDLNRSFPGCEDGMASQVYAHCLMNKVISQFNYLIDLHTASFGRVNSYYVRSDMNDSETAAMANLQQPQIILHNSGQDGTLRSACMARGIKAITVEIGNPQLFQNQYVQWSYMGVMRILNHFGMFTMDPLSEYPSIPLPPTTVLCSKGFWIYTRTGGVLEVYPNTNTLVRKGDLIARIKNIFGNVVDEYFAPCTGVAIGRSSNPVAMAGDRILHMGVIKKKGELLPKEAKENY